jgi:hypothetical protein
VGVGVYNGEFYSIQPFIKNSESLGSVMKRDPKLYKEITEGPQYAGFFKDLKAMDYVLNNTDRNLGNYLVEFNDDGSVKKLWAIDQDLSLGLRERELATTGFGNNAELLKVVEQNNQMYGKPSRITHKTYEQLVAMKTHEAGIRHYLERTYQLPAARIDAIFARLDAVLAGIDVKLTNKFMHNDDIFLD